MRFVTFDEGGSERYGVLVDDGTILDLPSAFAWRESDRHHPADAASVAHAFGGSMLELIQRQDRALPAARELLERAAKGGLPASFEGRALTKPLAGVRLLAPVPRPPSMRDGYAFRQHVMTARRNRGLDMIPEFDEFPVFYFTNHQAVTGPGDVLVQELHTKQLDFELEAAIVVGKGGKNLRASQADAHVFGLCIMNDWSARALQMQEMKLSLGPAKGKDFATSIGPWLVTTDELAERTTAGPHGAAFDLTMTAAVNGVPLSRGNLKDMTFTFAQILERASYGVNLTPGDVIGSGTVGTGCLLELNGSGITNQWLAPGDEVVLEIEKLGRLVNRVKLVDDR